MANKLEDNLNMFGMLKSVNLCDRNPNLFNTYILRLDPL